MPAKTKRPRPAIPEILPERNKTPMTTAMMDRMIRSALPIFFFISIVFF